MGRKARRVLPARVRKARDEIARWRRTRVKRSPMPAELWDAAIWLAQAGGTYATARALGVDYGSLARRVAEAQGGRGGRATSGPAFVELGGAPLLGAPAPAAVVELCATDGGRLVIQLGASMPLDVAELVQRFRERRA